MDPQKYIIDKIEPEMNETGLFPWLKYISETSLLKVEDYPALLIEDDKPLGSEGVYGDGSAMLLTGDYIMSLFVATKNLKTMTRADYKESKALVIKYMNELQEHIANCITADPTITDESGSCNVAGLSFEAAELGWVEIDSQPAIVLQVPVKTKYILS